VIWRRRSVASSKRRTGWTFVFTRSLWTSSGRDSLLRAFATRVLIHNQEWLLAQEENALAAPRGQLDAERKAVESLTLERDALQERLEFQDSALSEATRSLGEIYASGGWRVFSAYYRVRDRLFPRGSLIKLIAQRTWLPFSS